MCELAFVTCVANSTRPITKIEKKPSKQIAKSIALIEFCSVNLLPCNDNCQKKKTVCKVVKNKARS